MYHLKQAQLLNEYPELSNTINCLPTYKNGYEV